MADTHEHCFDSHHSTAPIDIPYARVSKIPDETWQVSKGPASFHSSADHAAASQSRLHVCACTIGLRTYSFKVLVCFTDHFEIQESRLLDGGSNECENLAERLAQSSSRVLRTEGDTGSIALAQEILPQNETHETSGHPKEYFIEVDTSSGRPTVKENPYLYIIGVTGYFKRLRELWKNRRCRRALVSAGVAMISQQLTGMNICMI